MISVQSIKSHYQLICCYADHHCYNNYYKNLYKTFAKMIENEAQARVQVFLLA